MITRVLNLATRQEWVYSLPPEKAVVCAAEQELGNWNTPEERRSLLRQDYDLSTLRQEHKLPVIYGKHTVRCGDWTAIRSTA